MVATIFFTIILLILPLVLLLIKQKLNNKKLKNPPGPAGLPIIGSLHQIGHLPHQSLYKLSKKYGPAMLLNLGSIPTLIVSNAEFAKEILQTHDINFCSRPISPGPKKLSYGYKGVAFAPNSPYRTEMRKIFSFELLKAKREHIIWAARENTMDEMISGISRVSADGTPVNLNEFVFALTDGITGQVAFGRTYAETQNNGQKLTYVLNETMNLLASFAAEDFFPTVGKYFDMLSGYTARLDKRFHDLDSFFTMVVEGHLDPKRPKSDVEDLVDVLIKLMKDGAGEFIITKEHIKSILFVCLFNACLGTDTFIGAIDTTSVGVVWAMSETFIKPHIMKKAQAQVRAVVGKKPRVEMADMENLPYIKNIVKEALRMHPSAPLLLPREAERHCKLGKEGYDIPPKTRVMINAWAIGRDENSWENPNEFVPERFENSKVNSRGAYFQFIPFGSGRRMCPGWAMGETTLGFAVANLLFGFDWSLPDGMKLEDVLMEEESGLTVQKKTPLVLKAKKYDWQSA